MQVQGKEYRSVWMEGNEVCMVDQTRLPFEFSISISRHHRQTAEAIQTMIVRGAGTIGATAAYGMVQALYEAPQNNFWGYVRQVKETLCSTRPTAHDLSHAVDRIYAVARKSKIPREAARKEAQRLAQEYVEAGRKIGEIGNVLIPEGCHLLTHCETGWLGLVDWGSALAPIFYAHRQGKKIFVWVSETRPRGQGIKLTSWELQQEGIPHAIIAEAACAHFLSRREIDLVVVGADRIAANGDTANKIGTLDKAILSKEYGIPFYVAAPRSTFDSRCLTGQAIPLEERSEDEILYQTGQTQEGKREVIRLAPPGVQAKNPAFDITPARYITGLITEKGILKAHASDIEKFLSGK